jgi:hypothetical protein
MPLSGLGAGRDKGVNPEVTGEPAIPVGLGKRCWFTPIATTIYAVYEGARARGFYSVPFRAAVKALAVPKDVRS